MMPVGPFLAGAYLKAYVDSRPGLKDAYAVSVRRLDRRFDPEATGAALAAEKPYLVGLSVYIWNRLAVQRLARRLKRDAPGTVLVLGGPEVAHRPERAFEAFPADYVVVGEGEAVFAQLLERLRDGERVDDVRGLVWRDGAKVRINPERPPIADLSEIPSPILSGILDPSEMKELSFETSRGCPFDCSFCDWQKNQKVRNFPVDRVVEEMKAIARARPDALVFFVDSDLFLNHPRATELVPRLIEAVEGTEILFDFETNLGHWDEPLMRVADHHRVHLSTGVQSVNPRALKTANRWAGPFDLTKIAANIKRVNEIAPRAVIQPETIFGMPDDTLDGYRDSLDWALGLRTKRVVTTPFLVLPGSPFAADPARHGIVFSPDPPYRLLSSDTWSEDDMAQARRLSYQVNLILSMNWFIIETVLWLGARAGGKRPLLETACRLADAFEADGRFAWIAEYKRSLIESLNFNMAELMGFSPNEVISEQKDPHEYDSSAQIAMLETAEAFARRTLAELGREDDLPGLERFLAAARARFARRELSRSDAFRRLLTTLGGKAGGDWLVVCREEDRGCFRDWTEGGRVVLIHDGISDPLRAEAAGDPIVELGRLGELPRELENLEPGRPWAGVILSDVYSYLPRTARAALFGGLAGATRAGGRIVVVDDGRGYYPFGLLGAAADGPAGTGSLEAELAGAGWTPLDKAVSVRDWRIVAAAR